MGFFRDFLPLDGSLESSVGLVGTQLECDFGVKREKSKGAKFQVNK